MLESKTTFIIGAGASAEAKLPVGAELTSQIAELLNFDADVAGRLHRGDHHIYETLRRLAREHENWRENQFLGSGRTLAGAMDLAPSIDAFLETHSENREFVLLGKLGIVRAIANAEGKSALRPNRGNNSPFQMRDLGGTWYVDLARQLFTGVPARHPAHAFEGVSFVVFNYDRCLEVFLVEALKRYFQISASQAVDIVSRVAIYHPYGSLGTPFPANEGHVPFAAESFDLLSSADGIRTYSEAVESDMIKAVQQAVRRAESIVFLGFAYHDQNMRLIDPEFGGLSMRPSRAFATTYGLSESDRKYVESEISEMLWGDLLDNVPKVQSASATCHDFFQAFWRSLSAPVTDIKSSAMVMLRDRS